MGTAYRRIAEVRGRRAIMNCPFLQVENSPFNAEQVELLNRLASTLVPDQWIWLSGYLAGVHLSQDTPATTSTAAPPPPTVSKSGPSVAAGSDRAVRIPDGQRHAVGGGTVAALGRWDFGLRFPA